MPRNYLQSPYYFMCCNLCDVVHDPPAQYASQSTLAGSLVSSLHRLKDVDNTGIMLCKPLKVIAY